jgi:phosphoglucomutase
MGLGGIINFTASHNPPLYNGIKFSPWHGGPADGKMTSRIESLVENGSCPQKAAGTIREMDPGRDYIGSIMGFLNSEAFGRSGPRVVYDAFSGTGAGLLDRVLVDLGASVRTINGTRDPLFAGRQHPEPGEEGTRDLAVEVTRSGANLGVATDGDADRFGLVDEKGSFVSPHDFLPLLLEYLINEKGLSGRIVRSVTTGSLLDRVARAHGLETVVTPVGFKYLGAEMLRGDVLLAGEESGGLSIRGHVPEKDGILACLLAAEMVSARDRGLSLQLEDLWSRYGRVFLSRIDVKLNPVLSRYVQMEYFQKAPSTVAGRKVASLDRTDGIRMVLENGDWLLIRLSGTEPLARIYAQSESQPDRDLLLREVTDEFKAAAEGR